MTLKSLTGSAAPCAIDDLVQGDRGKRRTHRQKVDTGSVAPSHLLQLGRSQRRYPGVPGASQHPAAEEVKEIAPGAV